MMMVKVPRPYLRATKWVSNNPANGDEPKKLGSLKKLYFNVSGHVDLMFLAELRVFQDGPELLSRNSESRPRFLFIRNLRVPS